MQPKLGRNRYGQGIFPKLAWESMTTTILRTLHYPATTLTQQHHDRSTSRAAVLRHRKDSPHALVYGPIEYQGLGIPICTQSRDFHIERILKYSHIDDDITGQLIRASVEQLNSRSGAMDPPYPPYADFSKLATTGSGSRRLWMHQIRIEDTTPDFLLSRANDC
jgi:hypothetical protein